jgi:TfdA family taurine catabolism dioxygenase TauD
MTIKEQIQKDGYVFLREYRTDSDDTEVASEFGKPSYTRGESEVQSLSPQTKDEATPNTYSGIYGYEKFPFHTDLAHWKKPPRYLLLRCVVGFKEVSTLVADGLDIIRVAGALSLSRALVQPRRPIDGKLPLLRILDDVEGIKLLRWDSVFLKPASKVGSNGMSLVQSAIEKYSPSAFSLKEKGDTLILDNWRMLHARSSINENYASRKIIRTYFEELF